MKIPALILVVTLVAVATLSVFFLVRYSGKENADQSLEMPEPATLALVDTTSAVLAAVALRNDYFREEGLAITPRLHSFGKLAMRDVLEGRADFATVAATPITVAVMNGEKISILATIQTSNRDNGIVALQGSGIRHPSDLKGRRIGVTLGTTADYYMDAFLSMHGIGGQSVEKVNVVPEMLQEALARGRVDAVSAFQPFLVQMENNLAGGTVSFYDRSIYTSTFNIVAKQEYVRANPGKVRKLLRALIRAEQFVQQQPEEAQKIIAGHCGLELELVRAIWPNMRFNVSLSQILVLTLEDQTRWAITSGSVAGKVIPNYLDYIYLDGLGTVNAKAVRILR